MQELEIDLATNDGSMPTWVMKPDDGGPFPVVLFLMDAPGMRQEVRDMASRLATAGYYVMTSQLYYREVREYNVFETGDRDRMFELMANLSNEMVNDDAKSQLDYAATDADADITRVGVVGYCMSGPFAICIAAAHNTQVKAAASIHGVRLVSDAEDSPHKQLDLVSGEVYIAAAETDSYAPPEMIDRFESTLNSSSAMGQVEWYGGTEHGFAYSERPAYDREASERHWERLHDLFRRNLYP